MRRRVEVVVTDPTYETFSLRANMEIVSRQATRISNQWDVKFHGFEIWNLLVFIVVTQII